MMLNIKKKKKSLKPIKTVKRSVNGEVNYDPRFKSVKFIETSV